VDNFSEYVGDLRQITGIVRESESGLPVFIHAHSMGAVVALLAVLPDQDAYQGLVLASPAIRIATHVPAFVVNIVAKLAWFLPKLRVGSMIKPGNLSHDPDIVSAYGEDPLVIGTVTLSWLASMLAAQREILRSAGAITTPALVLHSLADPVASIAGTERLVGRMRPDLVTFREYAAPFHELHNEIAAQREIVLHDVAGWLNRRLDPSP